MAFYHLLVKIINEAIRGNNVSLHQDIKDSINKHFGFLCVLGFSEFKEEQLAYEIHFRSNKDNIRINIQYEMISSTPVWITVNGMYLERLERENQIIKNVLQEKNKLYDTNFKRYSETDDTKYLDENKKLYGKFGETLNDQLIGEVANILQRNKNILSGDSSALKKASDEWLEIQEAERTAYLKANKIYTCDYTIGGLGFECEGSFEEIEEQLNSAKDSVFGIGSELSKIEIVDWNGNIVERKN